MTKDWDSVQDEIKELSFNQKKSLEEVKELMERKHKFRASTRAYRMKLKEWGLMRHKGRKARPQTDRTNSIEREISNDQSEISPGSAEPMSVDPESLEHRTRTGGWQVVSNRELQTAQPTFMGMLNQTPNLQPSVEVPLWMKEIPVVSDSVQDMLQCILDRDSEKLEVLLMEHVDDINQPVGLPFEPSNGRFAKHQALDQMVLMQHPHQTLLDIASGMPNGPSVWVLLTYGAQGSTHPLGFDLALHNAIRNGRQYNVQALCISDRSDVNGLDDGSSNPLLQAVSWTGPEVVGILLKRGARVDDFGPSPFGSGTYTALQLCLKLRANEYHNESVRSRCNENSKLLLKAGAGIRVLSPRGITASLFEMFIEPWRGCEHWSMKLSLTDMDCLNLFVEMGADLSAKFSGCPCAADSSDTFAHQALWHSPPCLSRRVLSSYSHENPTSGALLLHGVLDKCAAANRHCAEALEDIETLLARGVNPNTLDNRGMTPLRRCIEHSPAVDVLAMTQKLLDGGADPEFEDVEGMQPYAVAAQELPDPVRHEVLQAMLAKMQGQGACTRDDRTYRWEAGLFPIPESPSYQQVLSCTQPDGDFRLSMQEMLHINVQKSFRRAYFAVISGRLIENIVKAAASRKVTEKDRWNIMLTLSLRKGAKLPNYQFDQGLVIALLGFPKIDISKLDTVQEVFPSNEEGNIGGDHGQPDPPNHGAVPGFQPFQLNTDNRTSSGITPTALNQTQDPSIANDDFIGDTTQIRWRNPEHSKAPTSTAAFVLQHKCSICADGRLLTRSELQKHDVEHAHTAECDGEGCTRRFCNERRKREKNQTRCQDHLFSNSVK